MEKLKFLLVLTVILMVPSFAFATTYVNQIHEFAVSSQDMDGMGVDITFENGSVSTSWASMGTGKSGAEGTGWSITNTKDPDPLYEDDTMLNAWTLNNDATQNSELGGITRLTINGITAGIVFDIINSIDVFDDTPDSMNGWWDGNLGLGASNSGFGNFFSNSTTPGSFFLDGSWRDDGTATDTGTAFDWFFSEDIVVKGSPQTDPLDVWGVFTLNFANPFSGELNFDLDTDAASVPEPSTILLLGFGLLGLTAMGRKRA